MEIKGRVHHIGATEVIKTQSGKDFYKRELVLDTTRYDPMTGEKLFDNYPLIEFMGDKCSLLDDLRPSQIVTVSFDLQGREYVKDGKTCYITSVRGYKVEVKQTQAPAPQPQYEEEPF